MSNKKVWKLRPPPPVEFLKATDFTTPLAHVLHNRGITTPSEFQSFVNPSIKFPHDPSLLPGMDKALHRLHKAIMSGEVIGLFGDFDLDGVSGTALLTQGLSRLGAKVVPYLPHRVREGHGLNTAAVHAVKEQGGSILITVDLRTAS